MMQFLWGLLPGAREARNDLAIGYAWLVAVALFVAVPTVDSASNFGRLVDLAGPVGVGVAVSFAAALFGGFLSDLVRGPLDVRGRKFKFEEESPDELAQPLTGQLGPEATRLATDRDRIVANVDRLAGELVLRVLLLPPLLAAAIKAFADSQLGWGAVACAGALALAAQAHGRARELRTEQARDVALRNSLRQLRTKGFQS
jgi:hypothetical protein